jgi:hypothetical protein
MAIYFLATMLYRAAASVLIEITAAMTPKVYIHRQGNLSVSFKCFSWTVVSYGNHGTARPQDLGFLASNERVERCSSAEIEPNDLR